MIPLGMFHTKESPLVLLFTSPFEYIVMNLPGEANIISGEPITIN